VNFITRDPSYTESSGQVNLRAAQDGEYDISASVDIPLMRDRWAARVGARYYTTDGRYTSIADGGALGEEETKSVSLTLVGAPTDQIDLRFRAFYAEDNDGLPPTFALETSLHNCGPFFEGGKTYFCGTVPVITSVGLNTILEGAARDVFVNNTRNSQSVAASPLTLDSLGMERRTTRLSLSGDWQVGDTPYLVSFNSGFNWTEQYRMTDTDHTGQQVWVEANFQDIEDKAFELRLSRDHDRLSWMVGASYFDLEYIAPTGATVGYLYPNSFVPNGFFFDQTVSTSAVETTGIFASASYALTDTWSVNLEARYQAEKIQETARSVALEETFRNFLPRAILQWQPNDETNIYLSYAKGNMPGNFNGNVAQFNEAQRQQILEQTGATEFVDEAELDSVELGWKQSLLDGRAYFAAAAYFMRWENQQNRSLAVVDDPTSPAGFRTVPVVLGNAETDLFGLELEASYQPTDNLTLRGSFNWAASDIQSFNCDVCVRVLGTGDVSGNALPRFPEYSGSLSATYTGDINAQWDWFARGDAIYQGRTYAEVINLAETPEFWVMNVRGGIESDQWRFEAFITNVLDDEHYRSGARNADFTKGNFDITDFVINVTPAEPRQFGVRMRYRF
jgi:iron complex outermembrane recepter protein